MSKRLLDVVVSLAALLALWPLLLAVAVAIRLSMGSPVLFRQMRPGLNGELFELVKFRTMKTGDASDSERLTVLGKWLRTTSVDELPELWNILRGDMSLVGPRPLLPEYVPLYSDRQATRHKVRPGLTGLAQVNGRNESSWEERLELDAQYAESPRLRSDLRIMLQTIAAVVRRSGINADGGTTMSRFSGSSNASGPP